ncbi:MAG: Zn-ribbon domain-containing OB-fold protein [candidate division WOR-3 bacterium]
MAIKERLTKLDEAKAWYGEMPVESLYTVGIAGEKFFRAIKEDGKFLGTKCQKCDLVYVPPRIFCDYCFEELNDYVEVADCGTLESFTLLHIGLDGKKLEKPEIIGLINLDGATTNIIHRIGEAEIEELWLGMRVCAVFKPKAKREGSINDILYFKPTNK